MPKSITVGVITQAQGAHLDSYFAALAQTEEAGTVVLADPSGKTVERAKKALGDKLKETFKKARDIVREGKLGKVYGVEAHIIADQTRLKREDYRKAWYSSKPRAGGGHLIWLGIHWLDLVHHVTGLKVSQVTGFAGVVGGQPIDVEDSAAVALRFDNGCFGTMTSGYYLDRGYQSHVQVWGEHGWLRLASIEEAPLEWYSTRGTRPPKVQRF